MGSKLAKCFDSTSEKKKYNMCIQGHSSYTFKVISIESSQEQKFECNKCNSSGHSSVLACKLCYYQICTTTCFKQKHNEVCNSPKWSYAKSEFNKSKKVKCSFCKICHENYLFCKSCSAVSCGHCFNIKQWPCDCSFLYNQKKNLTCIFCVGSNKASVSFCSKCELTICEECYNKRFKGLK